MNYKIVNNDQKRYILFLHCICGNNQIFEKQFDVLKKYYNFIFVDLPAHGENIDVTPNFTFKSISLDIIDIIKKEKIDKVDVIAISLGSMILDDLVLLAPKGMINKIIFTANVIGFPLNLINPIFNFFVKHINLFPRFIYMYFITLIILPQKKDKIRRKKCYKNSLLMEKESLYRYFNIMNDYIRRSYKKDFKYLKYYCNDYIFINGNIDLFFIKVKKNLNNDSNLAVISKASHFCNIGSYIIYNKIIIDFLT